jgi:threonyl-tRNA synthetase
LGKKTRETQKAKVPFMMVIGDRELESNSVSLREYGAADSKTINLDDLKEKFKILDEEKVPEKLR